MGEVRIMRATGRVPGGMVVVPLLVGAADPARRDAAPAPGRV